MKSFTRLFVLTLFICSSISIGISNAQIFQFQIPSGEPTLTEARDVAVDSSGNIYVLLHESVVILDSLGNETLRFGTFGGEDGQFRFPQGLAIDSSGNIYVADTNNHRIQKFDSSGVFVLKFGTEGTENGEFNSPEGLAVDSSGNIYVADSENDRIQKFSSSGAFQNKYGTSGSGDGQFNSPQGVDVDSSGNIYVADTGNDRIQKLNSSGALQLKFGTRGGGDSEFNSPRGVAVDSSGNIYVTDTINNRIQKFNSSGEYQSQFGRFGSGDGQFNSPRGIEIDSSGNIYVADTKNHRIQKFDSSDAFQSKFGTFGTGDGQFNSPQGIALDGSGNIYVADTNSHRIQIFNSMGAFQDKFGTGGTEDGELNTPGGVAVDTSGNIYVADTRNNRIQIFSSSGTLQRKFGTLGDENGKFNLPRGLALDSSGNIYVADRNNHRIQIFNSSGVYQNQFGSQGSGDGKFSFPRGVAIKEDASGNVDIYVADTGNNRIQKFNSSRVFQSKFGRIGTGDGQFDGPIGIAVDGSGNIYVADSNNDRIQKFDSTGMFVRKFGTFGTGNGLFDSPQGLAVDASGNVDIYVADRNNHRIQVFSQPVCGDGIIEGDEECDDATANGTSASCCSGSCAYESERTLCDDGDACTTEDGCDGSGVCSGVTAVCDDGAFCNGLESCDSEEGCVNGTAPVIDDGVTCTEDRCDEVNDVVVNTPNNSNCDDGVFCNGSETCDAVNDCQAGAAVPADDGVSCTVDSCNEDTESIDNIPTDSLCDNGLFCDGEETCDAINDCQAGTAPSVDDGVACTDDSCDEVNDTAVNTANNANCDNGLFCDGEETCDAVNGCQEGTPVDPDDGIECTEDSCDEDSDQVVNTANNDNCDNGIFCDGEEICDAVNGCQEGTAVDPDDGIACTEDSCDEESDQVVNAPDDSLCDDNEFCTGIESCDADEGCIVENDPPDGEMCTASSGPEGMCMNGGCINEGVITIVKVANPRDGTDFQFGCTDEDEEACEDLGNRNGIFTLDDEPEQTDDIEATITSDLMFVGLYMIEELLPEGWQLDRLECFNDDDEESVLDPDNNMVMVDLDPGEDITCTFFNSSVSEPEEFLSIDTNLETITTQPGDMLSMSVDISNPASVTNSLTLTRQTAEGVIFIVEIPEGFTIEELATSQGDCDIELLECDLGDIEPGETVTVFVQAAVPEGEGVYRVSFIALTSSGQEFNGTATVNVQGEDTDTGVVADSSGGGGCAVSSADTSRNVPLSLAAMFMALIMAVGIRRKFRY